MIEKSAHGANSMGIATYRGRTQITYSCVANDNCRNSVHVISVYEARSTGFAVRSGSVNVHVSVTGEDTKPLILVLTSYYPIRWSLNIPRGVVFDKLVLVRTKLLVQWVMSLMTSLLVHGCVHMCVCVYLCVQSAYYQYLGQTSVSYSTGAITSVEKIACSGTTRCYADGYDGDTLTQLRYVSNRFGPVSSWSSAYRTDAWRLNITRRSG